MKLSLVLLLISFSAWANQSQSPYAGEENRDIKALGSNEIKELLEGKGMGFAKAAELNRYPGPRHVLDLAEELNLSSQQKSDVSQIFNKMQGDAMSLGSELVSLEGNLDDLFSSQRVSSEALDDLLSKTGETRAKLRGVHLHAHLTTKQILSEHQVMRYNNLRGYSGNGGNHSHQHSKQETAMSAKGMFSIELKPQEDAEHPAGRLLINKSYQGDMEGTGTGQMISKRTEGGTAVYYAVEEFSGSIEGKTGGFTLVHQGHMDSETQSLVVAIVEGSGSGELQSISGSMLIIQDADGHSYELAYNL